MLNARKPNLLKKEVRPSGNIVHYEHDSKDRLKRIYTTDPSNAIMMSWLEFSYPTKEFVKVTASNGKQATYSLKKRKYSGDTLRLLTNCSATGLPSCHYDYNKWNAGEKSYIAQIPHVNEKPDSLKKKAITFVTPKKEIAREVTDIRWGNGEFMKLHYDESNVTKISLPGNDGNPVKVCTIKYHPYSRKTTVRQGLDRTVYCYSKAKRLLKKGRYIRKGVSLKVCPYRSEMFFWGKHRPIDGNLITKGIGDGKGKLLTLTTYQYDSWGNILKETIAGHLTGYSSPPPCSP